MLAHIRPVFHLLTSRVNSIFAAMGGNRKSPRVQSSKMAKGANRQKTSGSKRRENPAQKKHKTTGRKSNRSSAISSHFRPHLPHTGRAVSEKESRSEVGSSPEDVPGVTEPLPFTSAVALSSEEATSEEVEQSMHKHENSFAVLSDLEETLHEPNSWEQLSHIEEKQSGTYPTLEDWPWTDSSDRLERLTTLVCSPLFYI
jgi:hypothetical protein